MKKILAFGSTLALLASATAALAAGAPATVTTNVNTCAPTTFSATTGSSITNQYLVVDDGASVQSVIIPANGDPADISVGPFASDTTVSWHVFGGGERDYDIPLWNGHGGATFSADITAYYNEVGTFSWVIAGTDDPNPFVTWNTVDVPACAPQTKNDCKKGGWETYGFKNQGQCVASLVSHSTNH